MSRIIAIIAGVSAAVLAGCGQEPSVSQPAEPAAEQATEQAADQGALDKLLAAVGGADALDGIQALSIQASGERFTMDEQYMPGDPGEEPLRYTSTGYYDAPSDSLRLDMVRSRAPGDQAVSVIMSGELGVISGQDAMFGPAGDAAMSSDRWAAQRKEAGLLNPHIAYRAQLLSGDVAEAADEMWNGANHHVLELDAPVAPIRLYVDAASGNLSRLTTMEAEYLRRDVEIAVTFDNWAMSAGGLAFPNEVTLTYDGQTMIRETRESVSVNSALDSTLFDFPAGVTPAYDEALAAWGRNGHQMIQMMASVGFPYNGTDENVAAAEIAPGVWHITGGSHHSLLVEQTDGLVVVDAPKHELRSEAVIDWIEEAFPGQPITHIAATHHHTDHTAGMRSYVARGATAVVHEAARDFFADIFSRSSSLRPDALSQSAVMPQIDIVPATGTYVVADAERAVQIYPLANEHAGDMVLVYVREPGVVFVTDIYSPNPNAPAGPGGQAVQATIEAAGIDVNLIVGGHGGVIDYAAFQALL